MKSKVHDSCSLPFLFIKYDAIYKTSRENLFEVMQGDQYGLYCTQQQSLVIPIEYHRIYLQSGPYALVTKKFNIPNGFREHFGLYQFCAGLVVPIIHGSIRQLSDTYFVVSEMNSAVWLYDATTKAKITK